MTYVLVRVLFGKTAIKQFVRINIGDFNKIISYMCLKLQLGFNFLMCEYCPACMTDRYGNQTTSRNKYTRSEELH